MRVRLTDRANRQVREAHQWYAQRSLSAAERWHESLMRCLRSLTAHASHCPLAAESSLFPVPVHEITFGSGRRKSHRVLFVIRPELIVVHSVRHLAQDEIDPETWDSSDDPHAT